MTKAAQDYQARYRVSELIGRGAMGVVHRAYDTVLRREVALKRLPAASNPIEKRRFIREARLAGSLKHPNIIVVHDVGEIDGDCFITMALVEGPDWHDHVDQLDLRDVASLMATVCAAVGFAHSQGIVHRDIKPANVLLDQQGVPCLADFGLAKQVQGKGTERLTASGEALGTPSYMSPEQIEGEQDLIGPPSDVWSLGVMLYELIAGPLPFERDSLSASLMAALKADPVAPRQRNRSIPRDLETICLKCLEKDPARRYPDALGLEQDLRAFLEDSAIRARRPSWMRRAARRIRRAGRIEAGVAVLAVTLISLLLGWHLWRSAQYAKALSGAKASRAASGRESLVEREKRLELARDHARQALFHARRPEALRLLAAIRSDLAQVRSERKKQAQLLEQARTIADVLMGPFADGKRAVEEAARLSYGANYRPESSALEPLRLRLAESARRTGEFFPDHPVVTAYEGYFLWLAGQRKEGIAQLKRVALRAPDHPFAHLFLALTLIPQYWKKVRPPEYNRYSRGQLVPIPSSPSDAQRKLARQINAHLGRAANAGVFPNIATSRAYRQFAAGIGAVFTGRPGRGVALFRNATWDPLVKYQGLSTLAVAYYYLNDHEKAVEVYAWLFKEAGRHRDCYYASKSLRIMAYATIEQVLAMKTYRRSLDWINRALKGASKSREYRSHKAGVLLGLAKVEPLAAAVPRVQEARKIIGALLRERDSVELLKLLGHADMVMVSLAERVDHAIRPLLLRAVTIFNRVWEMQGKQGNCAEDDWGLALSRLATLESNKLKKLVLLRKAKEVLDRAIANEPEISSGFLRRGGVFFTTARFSHAVGEKATDLLKSARDDFNNAIRLDPGDSTAHVSLAIMSYYLASIHPEERVKHLKDAIVLSLRAVKLGSSIAALVSLGNARFGLAMATSWKPFKSAPFLAAAKVFSQALELEPDLAEARLQRATIRLLLYKMDGRTTPEVAEVWMVEAIDDISVAFRLRPKQKLAVTFLLDATNNLIWARTKLGRGIEDAYRREIKALELAIKHGVRPARSSIKLADDWAALVRFLMARKKNAVEACKQAGEAYERAARLIAGDPRWKAQTARCWMMAGVMHHEFARGIAPRVGDVSKRLTHALGCYDAALQHDPGYHMVWLYRAMVALSLGRLKLAMGDIDRLEGVPALPLPVKRQLAQLRRAVEQARGLLRKKKQ